jgi:hypothetical protein
MLNSNAVFAADQMSQFSKTIADIKADMWVLNNEMSRLQKAMDHLATERQKLQTSLDGHLSLVAPIRRIPAEIQFSPIAVSTMEASVLRKRHCCSRLCAVKWRRIAISTPHLWSSTLPHDVSAPMDMLQTWLSRSGVSPLTLTIDWKTRKSLRILIPSNFIRIAGMT